MLNLYSFQEALKSLQFNNNRKNMTVRIADIESNVLTVRIGEQLTEAGLLRDNILDWDQNRAH